MQRWLSANHATRGAVFDMALNWQLSVAWYVDPRAVGWKPRTRDESQAVLASVGLVDNFWKLPEPG